MSGAETIGVDLGGTKMLVGAVGPGREVLYERSERSAGLSEEELVAELEAQLRAALAERPDAAAVGLGVPCTIDRERGVAIGAVNLPIRDLPLRDMMREALGLPVFIDNDANVAALAEWRFGAARGARNAVVLTVGTGIGGGLILDGRPFRGSSGAGAELGHVVVDLDGPPCQQNCPGVGHIEGLASGLALAREAAAAAVREPQSALGRARAAGEEIGGAAVTRAAAAGDSAASAVMEEVGRRLGAALSGFANIFDPDVIVIGGGVTAGAGEMLLGPAREEVRRRALAPMNEVPVVAAELGPEAGMVGAAALAQIELEAA